jgi:hypothetical protein
MEILETVELGLSLLSSSCTKLLGEEQEKGKEDIQRMAKTKRGTKECL